MHKPAQLALLAVGVLSAASVVPGLIRTVAGQTQAAPLPATYLTNAELSAALKKATEANPNMSTANVKNTDQYRINVVRRGRGAGALAHVPGTELHYIVDAQARSSPGDGSSDRRPEPAARRPSRAAKPGAWQKAM